MPNLKPHHSLLVIPVVAVFVVWRNWPQEPAPTDQALLMRPPQTMPPETRLAVEPPAESFALISTHGNVRCAWIDRKLLKDPDLLKGAALAIDDKDDRFCEILFWTDRQLVPTREWPMTEQQVRSQAASYWRNPATGEHGLERCDGRELKW